MSTCLRCWSCCCSSIVHSKYSNSSTIPCTRDANRDAAYVPNGVINEHEVDLSHFTKPTEVLGIGGFGLVRKVVKITGNDSGVEYAMKTTTKASILARSTGLQAMTSELKSMILCEGCEYICQLHYAFQDHSHIYFVLDHAIGGDMRYNMRRSPGFRFREDLARIFIKQVLLALHHCHQRSILHRGKHIYNFA